jgi:K+-transporting ATPase KdpF subunit
MRPAASASDGAAPMFDLVLGGFVAAALLLYLLWALLRPEDL